MSLTRAQILDLLASDAKLDEVKELVGEVGAAPTANTVLARLKELETKIDAIKDTAGVKKITDTVNAQLTGSNAVNAAVQNVTTTGTRVQLPNIACREITLIAKRANTGYIYIGGNDVSSAVYGAELEAKDSITIRVENANLLYIDASVSGEGISYVTV